VKSYAGPPAFAVTSVFCNTSQPTARESGGGWEYSETSHNANFRIVFQSRQTFLSVVEREKGQGFLRCASNQLRV
jgi:hypothetical protein